MHMWSQTGLSGKEFFQFIHPVIRSSRNHGSSVTGRVLGWYQKLASGVHTLLIFAKRRIMGT